MPGRPPRSAAAATCRRLRLRCAAATSASAAVSHVTVSLFLYLILSYLSSVGFRRFFHPPTIARARRSASPRL